MSYSFRQLTADDEPIVWRMLFEAARMAEEGETSPEAAKNSGELVKYAENWGRAGDLGFAAFEVTHQQPVGAAWIRLWTAREKGYGYLDSSTPELAMGVLPLHRRQGIGRTLLSLLIESARQRHRIISLNVRDDSPAVKLYERAGFEILPGTMITNRVGGCSFNMRLMLD